MNYIIIENTDSYTEAELQEFFGANFKVQVMRTKKIISNAEVVKRPSFIRIFKENNNE